MDGLILINIGQEVLVNPNVMLKEKITLKVYLLFLWNAKVSEKAEEKAKVEPYQIIKQVGNYGEIFERNIGVNTPLGIARGLNALWTKGGLMYSPPDSRHPEAYNLLPY